MLRRAPHTSGTPTEVLRLLKAPTPIGVLPARHASCAISPGCRRYFQPPLTVEPADHVLPIRGVGQNNCPSGLFLRVLRLDRQASGPQAWDRQAGVRGRLGMVFRPRFRSSSFGASESCFALGVALAEALGSALRRIQRWSPGRAAPVGVRGRSYLNRSGRSEAAHEKRTKTPTSLLTVGDR